MRQALLALMLAAGQAVPAAAQAPVPNPPPNQTPAIVRWGKWGAAALFIGFTVAGAAEHQAADAQFADLQQYCFAIGPCTIGPDGRYSNPDAEALYQDVVVSDRTARAFLVTGQVALAGAAALFVIELMNKRGTKNVPLSGLMVAPARGEEPSLA